MTHWQFRGELITKILEYLISLDKVRHLHPELLTTSFKDVVSIIVISNAVSVELISEQQGVDRVIFVDFTQ